MKYRDLNSLVSSLNLSPNQEVFVVCSTEGKVERFEIKSIDAYGYDNQEDSIHKSLRFGVIEIETINNDV